MRPLGNFLPDPFPERIIKLGLAPVNDQNPMLSIGLQTITKSMDGLKVVPHKAVVFAMGTQAEPEQQVFDVPLSMMRDIALRIIAMCDAA